MTNFKEFAIYDCRFKPNKEQEANVARVLYLTYDKFLDNFAPIYSHLDKDFVLSGQAFDRYKLEDRPGGTLTLDEDFSEHIRAWRLKFANSIYLPSKTNSIEFISEHTQLFIDRVIFCRVAEGLRITEKDTLLNIVSAPTSWKKLKEFFSEECSEKFGGLLFGDKKLFDQITFSDNLIKEFISTLYYPNPYRFDVITPVLLGNIYERYLGRKLDLKDGKVIDDFKEEYQKTKGAVYTPDYIVCAICEKALGPISENRTFSKIKELEILDPSCGSGSFLLGVFDFISEKANHAFSSGNLKEAEKKYFWVNPRSGKSQLRVFAKREIINKCIFGVDIDPQAVEVARLSLSLKALESASLEPIALRELGLLDSLVLDGIGNNIKLGNSLVDSRIFQFIEGLRSDVETVKKLKPFDWENEKNFAVVMKKGGFDAVVGNPPYIEIKHYKKNSPAMHKYLSESKHYGSCGSGKTDISMPFIERSLQLLKPNGRLGFIIQSRFFKTDYGDSSRGMLSDSGNIEEIVDFGALKVFEKRTTYTCIIILSKSNLKQLNYVKIDNLSQIEAKLAANRKFNLLSFKTLNRLGNEPWFFVHPDLKALRKGISDKCGTIKDFGNKLSINVGLQVLYKKYYFIRGNIKGNRIVGQNYAGLPISIEKSSCRPLAVNRNFYPFKILDKDNFALFPYNIKLNVKKDGLVISNLECAPLDFSSFCTEYPVAGEYLKTSKKSIQDKVETLSGSKWHLYTYEKNHCLQSLPKILIPSTCKDTTATVDIDGEFYQDNVRVNSIVIEGAHINHYKAIATVFNSKIFDCLAKITAESLDNGYTQLNKQFILPVPLPVKSILNDDKLVTQLASIYDEMQNLTNCYAKSTDKESKEAVSSSLNAAESALNEVVNLRVYKLTSKQIETLETYCNRSPIESYIDHTLNDISELDFVEDTVAG
ncbi:MAG: N-6 DNA methylase [Bdellovibrionota bacterium]